MSHEIITSDCLVELPPLQQELLLGGVNYQLKENNFTQDLAKTTKTNNTSPQGNSSQSNTQLADVSSHATSFTSSQPIKVPV
ncbi:CTB family bacteriocin [Chrysosporum bergii ANA360D]|jgi:hypothetical protein|uniref:CTB family bacteriocin n=1 Tax=Chrysosporum bergii ANA360D TaxID=617107 RepID=A0AA43GNE7_9CYAN|nr:CTB family bacteriocin [Chrysosporum bergii]MDH6058958.1 CTB family bacteriocin [Chrysosporum bergii ANA360D]